MSYLLLNILHTGKFRNQLNSQTKLNNSRDNRISISLDN